MSRIFISYRREDTGMGVGRLADSLREHFAREQVFQDISSIDPGADFIDVLREALADCAAVLVVIGPKWLTVADRQGRRRLDDPEDWVRQEIVEALGRRDLKVFPLLVDGANMPSPAELPDVLKPLARRQAYELTLRHWAKDVEVLVEMLKRIPALATEASQTSANEPSKPKQPVGREPAVAPAAPQTVSSPIPDISDSDASQTAVPQVSSPPRTGTTKSGDGGSGARLIPWKPLAAAAAVVVVVAVGVYSGSGKKTPNAPSAERPPSGVAAGPAPPSAPAVGETFRDCDQCPEMVVVGEGSYSMGSPPDEKGRSDDEGPQHPVKVAAFALGRTAVTVGEFKRFVAASGYKTEAERSPDQGIRTFKGESWEWTQGASWRAPGFSQTDEHAVVGVSWNDAQAYVKWIAERSKEPYRLPSEAEREYATRAKTTTSRFWGDDPDQACRYGNVADASLQTKYRKWLWAIHGCDDGHVHTAPAGSFDPNAFKLYDMIGNVWEWTQDCWNDNYKGAPAEGNAWESRNCGRRVARGGSWSGIPRVARAACRIWVEPDDRGDYLGFRLARTL